MHMSIYMYMTAGSVDYMRMRSSCNVMDPRKNGATGIADREIYVSNFVLCM